MGLWLLYDCPPGCRHASLRQLDVQPEQGQEERSPRQGAQRTKFWTESYALRC